MCADSFSVSSRARLSLRPLAILSLSLLFALCMPTTSDAQTNSGNSLPATSPTLSELRMMCSELVTRLQARIDESTILSGQALKLQAEAETLRADLLATSTSLDKLKADYDILASDFAAYRAASDLNIADVKRERDAALSVARINGLVLKIGAPILAAESVYIIGHFARWW